MRFENLPSPDEFNNQSDLDYRNSEIVSQAEAILHTSRTENEGIIKKFRRFVTEQFFVPIEDDNEEPLISGTAEYIAFLYQHRKKMIN
jgi:hypothetical protein